jgi:hypothetical protein
MYREMLQMWNMKFMILAIIGATRVLTKFLKNNLEAIPGKHSVVYPLQKTAVIEASHTVRKALQSEARS